MCAVFVLHSYISLVKLCVLNQPAKVLLFVIKFASDLWQIGDDLLVLGFPSPIKKMSEDTKGVISSRKPKDRQYNDQKIPKG